MHLNEHSDFYYRHLHGDKDTFHFAWRMLGREYAMVPHPIHTIPGTMCQHDFDGNRLFQHRNRDKWSITGTNRQIEGFLHEEICQEFVREFAVLTQKFSGENDERTDQQYGYDGNEDVGDDQAIAQAPKQSTAAPGNHAKNQIQRGEDRKIFEEVE